MYSAVRYCTVLSRLGRGGYEVQGQCSAGGHTGSVNDPGTKARGALAGAAGDEANAGVGNQAVASSVYGLGPDACVVIIEVPYI